MKTHKEKDQIIFSTIEKLILYGRNQHLLAQEDVEYARNRIYAILGLSQQISLSVFGLQDLEPEDSKECLSSSNREESMDHVYDLLKILTKDVEEYKKDCVMAEIMNALIPRNSEENRLFWENYQRNPIFATDEFYRRSMASTYIRMDRVRKNKTWKADDFVLTINLSKPERTPEEIEAMRDFSHREYPKCMLCKENIGFEGGPGYPPRQNLRAIHVELGGEPWLMQYSPYSYYDQHAIVFSAQHRPMHMDGDCFQRLLDFVSIFPHYFIGSNADLPLVGGSILSHDHYQAGKADNIPLFLASVHKELSEWSMDVLKDQPEECCFEVLDWPMAVFRFRSKDKNTVVKVANKFFMYWIHYTNQQANILSHDRDGNRHSTVTPIARYNKDIQNYELYLVLRNNRKTKEYPSGLFHTSPTWHSIKRENIGIIETLGIAVLPARLDQELPGYAMEAGAKDYKEWTGKVFRQMLSDCNVFKFAHQDLLKHFISGFSL